MITHYVKIALRNIQRFKGYAFIKIAGLAVGMASTILILLWVQNELNYDKFHAHKNEIYRLLLKTTQETGPETPYPLVDAVKNEVPEVAYSTFFMPYPRVVISNGERSFYEENMAIGGRQFFSMFSFPFLEGDPKTALSNANSIVLTESMAKQYFPNENAFGKTVKMENILFTITGIIRDVPGQSHLQFNCMMSPHYMENKFKDNLTWGNAFNRCYVQVEQNANVQEVSRKINDVLLKRIGPEDVKRFQVQIIMQPLQEIYLTKNVLDSIYIFSILALFILCIGCINYVNLSTALMTRRVKEVGLRKVVGANRMQLIRQFVGETLVHIFAATALAIGIVFLCLPLLVALTKKHIAMDFLDIHQVLIIGGVILATAILASCFPALIISSLNPSQLLKQKIPLASKSSRMRGALVVIQYAISIGLLICTLTITNQLTFMRTKNLGFDKNSILYVPFSGKLLQQYDAFRNELLKNPSIEGVTSALYLPTSGGRDRTDLEWDGKDPNLTINVETPTVDYNFLDVLGLKISRGRNFSKEYSTDATDAFIINQEAADRMGIKDPVGKEIQINGKRGKIIGIVSNAHFLPLRLPIEPQVFSILHDYSMVIRGVIMIKVNGAGSADGTPAVISSIESTWNKFNPELPFEYHLWGRSIDDMYGREDTMNKLFNSFTILAIILSCLGLFGMASFTVARRTKEIGVRKVLGATIPGIGFMLSKEFIKWVLIANILAWPLAYYFMSKWLDSFAYHISLGVFVFLLSALLAILVALSSVSVIAIKAARSNPVKSLRYE